MTTTTTSTQFGLQYWIAQTLKTRRYGHTYVHAGARHSPGFAFRAFEHDGIIFSYRGWGRSLNTGGHKYKVHATYAESGKPVPAKVLHSL
jgi:hypothetical protein